MEQNNLNTYEKILASNKQYKNQHKNYLYGNKMKWINNNRDHVNETNRKSYDKHKVEIAARRKAKRDEKKKQNQETKHIQ